MNNFIDSGVFIGAFIENDMHHEEAKTILKSIAKQRAITSDYIVDETVTYIRRKAGIEKSVQALEALTNSESIEIVQTTEKQFETACEIFRMYSLLSFTDAITIAIMFDHNTKNILSFDSDFDAVSGVTRITTI